MEKKYKIYSLETSNALYGIVHNSQYDKEPTPNVLCEVNLGHLWRGYDSEQEAMGFIETNKEKLKGKTLVILPTINVPYV